MVISFYVRLAAWAIALLVRVAFRVFTMVVAQRFPAATLPDVELFTALWLLTQAQYAFRFAFLAEADDAASSVPLRSYAGSANTSFGDLRGALAESNPAVPDDGKCHRDADDEISRSSSGGSGGGSVRGSQSTQAPPSASALGSRPDPLTVTETLVLFPRVQIAAGDASPSPRFGAGVSPGMAGGVPPAMMSANGSDRGGNGRSILVFITPGEAAAQRRIVSKDLLHVVADAGEMDLAIVNIRTLQSGGGAPNLEATLDQLISDLRALGEFVGRGMRPAGGSESSIESPTTAAKLVSFMASAPTPVTFILGGAALGATVAMLALARRYPAMAAVKGLLLFDPFVGWNVRPHSRQVSFLDDSMSQQAHGNGNNSVSNGDSGSYATTPARTALPGIISGSSAKRPLRTWTRKGLSMRDRAAALVLDIAAELGGEVKTRCRKTLVTRALRQWFPAAQWSSNGSDVPVMVVLDQGSIWYEDQAEFVVKWSSTGDDIEALPWLGDRFDPAFCPTSGTALRRKMGRIRSLASPTFTRRYDRPLAIGDVMQNAAQWLLSVRGCDPTPTMSVGVATPAMAMRGLYRGNGAPSYVTTTKGPPPPGVGDLGPLPAPMLRVVRRMGSRDALGHGTSPSGNSLVSVEEQAERLGHVASNDSISDLLR